MALKALDSPTTNQTSDCREMLDAGLQRELHVSGFETKHKLGLSPSCWELLVPYLRQMERNGDGPSGHTDMHNRSAACEYCGKHFL